MQTEPKFKKGGMFEGSTFILFQCAAELRKNLTLAEARLWQQLKNKNMGVKFRRQHPIAGYIADFYCHKARLIIEVDGDIHSLNENNDYDLKRKYDLKEMGYRVMRFTNQQVLNSMDEVLRTIKSSL